MNGSTEILLVILLVAVILYLVYESYLKKKREESSRYVTREILVCLSCNYVVEKDFEPGDFIGLIKDTCPRCGGKMRVKGIYSI